MFAILPQAAQKSNAGAYCNPQWIVLHCCAVIEMKNKLKGSLSLLIATVIWGFAFIAQSVGMDHIGPFTFQFIRCGLAVAFLVPLSFLVKGKETNVNTYFRKWTDPALWKAGFFCGLALFAAASLQQIGLVSTDAGKAGFITAMYIVLVPILGIFLGQKPSFSAVVSVLIAVLGLYLLSCVGSSGMNTGDLLILGCAFAFAIQIRIIDRFAGSIDGLRLNCVQSLVVTLLSIPFAVFTERIEWHAIWACRSSLLFAGVLSMGVAYSLQIIGQKHLEPTPAALIMSLESVFAMLGGWLILKETMTPWELLGCGLVFAAVIISQLPKKSNSQRKRDAA